MEVRVRGRGIRITEEIRAHAQARVTRASRFFDRVGGVEVSIVRVRPPDAGQRFRAEMATRSTRYGVRAEGEGDTVEHALDAAADHLAARLRRLGERLTDRRRQRPRDLAREDARARRPGVPAAARDEIPEIVRSRRPIGKPMTPEDAALTIDQEALSFLVFKNAETGRIGVLYRRADGMLGLIDPE